jgi:hypothetical protein
MKQRGITKKHFGSVCTSIYMVAVSENLTSEKNKTLRRQIQVHQDGFEIDARANWFQHEIKNDFQSPIQRVSPRAIQK